MPYKKVFLSSTAKDLQDFRVAAAEEIDGLDDYKCIRMERFGARNSLPQDFCRVQVRECDLFVGILGHCYGSVPPGGAKSYTEEEYDIALDLKKPRLIFIAPENLAVPAGLRERDDLWQKQRHFRERVSSEVLRDTFNSPDDLAKRVSRAIRNWEVSTKLEDNNANTAGSKATGALRSFPPDPDLVHPYPLQECFTGRIQERSGLSSWFNSDAESLLVLTAIGGMGKSSLSWVWVNQDALGLPILQEAPQPHKPRAETPTKPDGVLWWSFYEQGATFVAFLDELLEYASGGAVLPKEISSENDKLQKAVFLLSKKRILVVLDGFERELVAYAGLDAAYKPDETTEFLKIDGRTCLSPYAAEFLRSMASIKSKSRVLITSRLFPKELDGLAGVRRVDLAAMHLDDTVAYFRAQNISATRTEIEATCSRYGYHPLAIRLLVGMIANDPERPRDISVAANYDPNPLLVRKEHHILELSYNALQAGKRTLLSRIAAFRSPVQFAAIKALASGEEQALKADLAELVDRGLLFFDKTLGRFDLHPIVRNYAYDRLTEKEKIHTSLRDYFAAISLPSTPESIDELVPVIELYHHTVAAGLYDEAFSLFQARLERPLYDGFAEYQTCVELLTALFPDGENRPPRLSSFNDQKWALNTLANCYSLSGRSWRAISLYETQNKMLKQHSLWSDLAVSLENLADDLIKTGQLSAAQDVLSRREKLQPQLKNSLARRNLARLYAYEGNTRKSLELLASDSGYTFSWLRNNVGCTYIALAHLISGQILSALKYALRALRCAGNSKWARTQAEWILSWTLVEFYSRRPERRASALKKAETYTSSALHRCRATKLVEFEAEILLVWAKWFKASGDSPGAERYAKEALQIAERCQYRLTESSIHNFLAQLKAERGEKDAALSCAEKARERSKCDGSPHCYKLEADAAERLIRQLR